MKVFISHQQADSAVAGLIATRLRLMHEIDSYLDLIDTNIAKTGDQLGDYLRDQMGKCDQLMAVVSSSTKESWWVPWEIGIATEKDYPLATFAGDSTRLPEYLRKWPYLTSMNHVDEYARVSKRARDARLRKSYLSESQAKKVSTSEFFRDLRAALGQ